MNSNLALNPTFSIAYRGTMFEIVTWEGKPGITFEAAVRAPGVRLLIETEKLGEKALLMTREMRREAGGYDIRLPGGKVFDSLDELDAFRIHNKDIVTLAQAAAIKEGKEEAGISEGTYELLEISKAGASVEWDLYYFKVVHSQQGEQHLEDSEQGDIDTIVITAREIFDKLCNREIKEGRSADMLWWWLQKNGYITFNA
jgi:8-oxo-dGTP pyrophosphatase MutT (NUDIX family)